MPKSRSESVNFSRLFPRLRANAAVIDALVRDPDDVQARWRPDTDSWSILEVINHLIDEEVEDFRMRIGLTLEHPGRPWPANDPAGWPIARSYNERDFGGSVARPPPHSPTQSPQAAVSGSAARTRLSGRVRRELVTVTPRVCAPRAGSSPGSPEGDADDRFLARTRRPA